MQVLENHKLHLGGCKAGEKIDKIVFASYGITNGTCPAGFAEGKCGSSDTQGIVEKLCVGKTDCSVLASNTVFGKDPCVNEVKELAVEVHCSGEPAGASCEGSCYAAPAPTPPTPVTRANATWPKISGQVQTENHILKAGNAEPISTLFCWHGPSIVPSLPTGVAPALRTQR